MKYYIAAFIAAFVCLYVTANSFAKNRATTAGHPVEKSNDLTPEKDSPNAPESDGDNDDPGARARFEQQMLQDPATGQIPPFIRQKELQFASRLPARGGNAELESFKSSGAATQATNWSLRGPFNIGGRTRALGIDVGNESVIIAGGVSGGAWRSVDDGNSWDRTTPLNTMPSMTCLAQDTRAGKTNVWYYGTGERIGNSEGYPLQDYVGDGIFKSTDDGVTWNLLPSTATNSVTFNQPFNYIYTIATDPSRTTQDIVYAATIFGIERSSDGGATWTMTLQGKGQNDYFSDVSVASSGVVYAAINDAGAGNVYRSTDGITWTDITPSGWQGSAQVISLAVAPSNPNIVYFLFNQYRSGTEAYNFWKYTYSSGSGAGSGGTWEDRSADIPQYYNAQGGYDLYVKVKPDNPDVVFIGGVELYRSTDGFASPLNISQITGYIHVDQHAMAFYGSNPSAMIIGNDGGIYTTQDNMASGVNWTSLDNGYYTTQFYTVAVDHSTPGNNIVIGGMQDNSTFFTSSTDPTQSWHYLQGGDGTSCLISAGRSSYYVSYEYGVTYREIVDDNGDVLSSGRIDPSNGGGYLWVNPMVLDPNNSNMMYFGGNNYIWRNTDATQIPLTSNQQQTQGWEQLSNTTIASGSITAIAVSTTPANRIYYGTSNGLVYRLDNANTGNPTPVNVSAGAGFPSGGYINCIAVDDQNADNAIAVFSNYDVLSLFYTSNGGTSWKSIGGNLEQYPDGSGNGPSCRWATILHVNNSIMYYVGTSTGLYSTAYLNGMSTVWSLEGVSTIGNNIVAMMDARESDGLVAVASHGAGVFTGNVTSVPSAPSAPSLTFPTDGSVNMPQKTVLQWNADPSAYYVVQVATDQAFNNIVYQSPLVMGGTDTASGLQGQTQYYWRVQAANSGGVSPYSIVWNYTTIMALPVSPSLLSPSTGTTGATVHPTLQWRSVRGASTYQLQMSTSYSFGTPFLNDSLITDTFYIPSVLTINKRYYWRVRAANIVGEGPYSTTWIFTTGATGVNAGTTAPQEYALDQNYPNPFTGATNFNFTIAEQGMATLKIYDVLGKEVAIVLSEYLSPGTYSAAWNAGALPHGVYFYRLESGAFTATKQMALLK